MAMKEEAKHASEALGHDKGKAADKVHHKEFHAKEVKGKGGKHGGYITTHEHHMESGQVKRDEGVAADLDGVHDQLEAHMGTPNEGEEQPAAGGDQAAPAVQE